MKKSQTWIVVLGLLLPQVAWGDDPCAPCGGNCGEALGTLSGVDAFSNGARGNCTGTGRGFYQCVEYAKRFHGQIGVRWGNANQIFGRAGRLGLRPFQNGETEAPRQGDAITFQGGRYGHIAVIYEVGSNFITLIEQNWHNIPDHFRRLSMAVEGGRYTVASDSRNYTVEGWLRSDSDPTTTDDDGDGLAESEGDCNDTNPDIHPGAGERCDNLDNNCADGVDEEPAASYSCRDSVDCTEDICMTDVHDCTNRAIHAACEDGDPCTTNLCLLWVGCRAILRDEDLDTYTDSSCGGDDCNDGDFDIHPDAPERCNYLDDDCDGEADEDWRTGFSVDLGEPCEHGVGECYRTGVWDCEPLHRGTVCTAEIVSGTPETCDDLDNDCDGETDEDWLELGFVCGTPPCEGTYICFSDGLTSYCNVTPGSSEICDGVDNDCDGETDESPAELACADASDCTEDVCLFGLCQNVARDRDHDTYADDLCGGSDCNDLNPAVWAYTFTESRFTNSIGGSHLPMLVWTGSELGVVWQDQRDGNPEIYFARANTSLAKIGDDIRGTNAMGNSRDPAVVWIDSGYGLVWVDDRSGVTDLYFTRLGVTGLEIGDDIQLTNNTLGHSSYTPSMVWTGSEYAIAFVDRMYDTYIDLIRLNPDGTPVGPSVRLVADTPSFEPSFVWTGIEYGLSWLALPHDVGFARFTSTGSRIGAIIGIPDLSARSVTPRHHLVWQGYEFVLVWSSDSTDDSEIYFGRVDPSGVEIGSEVQVTDNLDQSELPTIASRGNEYGLTWEENPSGLGGPSYFVRLDREGNKLGSEIEVSSSQGGGERASLVWTGHEYILVWPDSRDGDWEIYLGRVSCGW